MIYATCLSLLLAAAALAADIKIEGETKVEGNKLVRLNVAAPEKSGVIWDVWPEGKADVEEIPGGKLIFTGPSGEYTVKARVITSVDGGIKIDTGRATVTIGTPSPIPPGPGPDPGPDPAPPDPPSPPAPQGFRVIFVYESGDPLSLGQTAAMYSESVRAYLDSKAAGWRRWDKDVDPASEKDASIKALWEAARPKVTTVPCVIIAVGGKAEILPLPTSSEESLKLLQKYGG